MPVCLATHDGINGRDHGSNNIGSYVENAGHRRRVAFIKVAFAFGRHPRHFVDVVCRMKKQQVVNARPLRRAVLDHVAEIGCSKLVLEHAVPVQTERMRIAEAVAGKFIALVNKHRIAH